MKKFFVIWFFGVLLVSCSGNPVENPTLTETVQIAESLTSSSSLSSEQQAALDEFLTKFEDALRSEWYTDDVISKEVQKVKEEMMSKMKTE